MGGFKPVYTQADLLENKAPLKIESSGHTLLKFRLCLYVISFLHETILAGILLPVDFTASDDPNVRRMSYMRHLLITAWTNYMLMLYLPLCIYVDWHELKGLHFESQIKKLSKLRHFMFMALVNPVTLYTGNLFWRIFNLDREQVVPEVFDAFLPSWMQHNLHTVPMLICLVELCVVPRFKPHNSYYHKLALKIFLTLYLLSELIVHDYSGYFPYPFFNSLTPLWLNIFALFVFLENLFIYHAQWYVPELIWGSRLQNEIVMENTKKHIDVVNYSVKRDRECVSTNGRSM